MEVAGFQLFSRRLLTIETYSAGLGAIMLVIMGGIICADTAMRFLFNRPFSWSYDLVGAYLMVASFYFCLPLTFSRHGHVRADVLREKTSERLQRIQEIVTCVLSAALFTIIAYLAFVRAVESYELREQLSSGFAAPAWPPAFVVGLGSAMLALRLCLSVIGNIASLVTGQSVVDLPVASGAIHASEQKHRPGGME